MPKTLKTLFFDAVRKFYANRFFEPLLLKLADGKSYPSLAVKLLPMPHLYPRPSWRVALRNSLKLKLDISDLVDWHAYFNLSDPSISLFLSKIQATDIVLDVGSNIGYVALQCAQKANLGHVYGFEPSKKNFTKCTQNLQLNHLTNINVFQLALGQTPGKTFLKVESENNSGMARIDHQSSESNEEVIVKTIDQVVEEASIKTVNIIKLDVEGFELNVLKGAINTIRKFRPKLFLEVDESFLQRFQNSSEELFSWIRSNDYEIFDTEIQPVISAALLKKKHQDIYCIPVTER